MDAIALVLRRIEGVVARNLGGGCTHIMHGRSGMTIDPHIPIMPGRSTSGLTDLADIACTKREAP